MLGSSLNTQSHRYVIRKYSIKLLYFPTFLNMCQASTALFVNQRDLKRDIKCAHILQKKDNTFAKSSKKGLNLNCIHSLDLALCHLHLAILQACCNSLLRLAKILWQNSQIDYDVARVRILAKAIFQFFTLFSMKKGKQTSSGSF